MVTRPVRPTTQMRTVVGLDPVVADALRSHLAAIEACALAEAAALLPPEQLGELKRMVARA